MIDKPNTNGIITNFDHGAKLPRNSDPIPHNENLPITHRDISGLNKSSVTPIDDAVIIQFIPFVRPTHFRDISTTHFIPVGMDMMAYWGSGDMLVRPIFLVCGSKNRHKKANKGLSTVFFGFYRSLDQ